MDCLSFTLDARLFLALRDIRMLIVFQLEHLDLALHHLIGFDTLGIVRFAYRREIIRIFILSPVRSISCALWFNSGPVSR